jgi:hypothetical protein
MTALTYAGQEFAFTRLDAREQIARSRDFLALMRRRRSLTKKPLRGRGRVRVAAFGRRCAATVRG